MASGGVDYYKDHEWPDNAMVIYEYDTPDGAEYLAVCLPAFSPDTVHRDA